jgi:hypothetical protein
MVLRTDNVNAANAKRIAFMASFSDAGRPACCEAVIAGVRRVHMHTVLAAGADHRCLHEIARPRFAAMLEDQSPNMRANRPTVLIKRFGGSRLYNTETKIYVTLVDLSDLLVRGRRIVVHEAETGEDVTSEILDQLH